MVGGGQVLLLKYVSTWYSRKTAALIVFKIMKTQGLIFEMAPAPTELQTPL